MSVRVRFAPSPTGYLHIGGARTALYGHLAARASNGRFILRIEDTDPERSRQEYEKALIDDLRWAGLSHHEGPDCGGDFGPYRQSERLDLYREVAEQLIGRGQAYPCFLSASELEELTEQARAEGKAPHAYHGRYRDLAPTEAKKRQAAGESYVVRFKNPETAHSFTDLVRGEVSFPPDMVGDFVLLRANKRPVYNFCCMVDDWKMQITHVIRGEEHLNNTLRQLMLYKALEVPLPQFAHCSLLVDENRQKLSKRSGATSVRQYRDEGYLPSALLNYLYLLGQAHPEEKDIFSLEEAIHHFKLEKLHKAPAFYDTEKLKFINGKHLRELSGAELLSHCHRWVDSEHPFHGQDRQWRERCLLTFVGKVNLPSEFAPYLDSLFDKSSTQDSKLPEVQEILSWESTVQIARYLKNEMEQLEKQGLSHPAGKDFDNWMASIKKDFNIKGKALFKGVRVALTGRAEGSDLKHLIPLTPVDILLHRLKPW